MSANVGDRYNDGAGSGVRNRTGKILEVKGPDGTPPYLVRFDDGQEQLVYPGPTAVITPASDTDA
ncbi:DUF1918 domain-containing protein [Streptomyces sp. NPDC015171]|uniref:DUF1918 domain-containing protein n=1 Tax=Streptomyces sp. NPDC015171 TaxID=3364945 RepID=UPI0036F9536E